MTRRAKVAASLFIAAFVGLGLIDATPLVSEGHGRLQARIDPVLDATGLWQGKWQLFAPDPRSLNVWISARLVGDGPPTEWRTPDWRQMGIVEKFFHVRHMKFIEGLRLDANRAAWEAFADYPLRQVPPEARRGVRRIELYRQWRDTRDPRVEWIPAGSPVEPDRSFLFFAKEVR